MKPDCRRLRSSLVGPGLIVELVEMTAQGVLHRSQLDVRLQIGEPTFLENTLQFQPPLHRNHQLVGPIRAALARLKHDTIELADKFLPVGVLADLEPNRRGRIIAHTASHGQPHQRSIE